MVWPGRRVIEGIKREHHGESGCYLRFKPTWFDRQENIPRLSSVPVPFWMFVEGLSLLKDPKQNANNDNYRC